MNESFKIGVRYMYILHYNE